jgi:hypothetical protein
LAKCDRSGSLNEYGLARYILDLRFSDRDKARMHDLAVRNQHDALTPAENDEMFVFRKAGIFLPF